MRLEYKYLIPVDKLDSFRRELLPFVNLDDKHNDGNEYIVRSIYFDTHDLRFYREKVEGYKIRKKLRIRGYNFVENANPVFLEIKRKNDGYINKNRAPLEYQNLDEFLESASINDFIIKDSNGELHKRDAEKFLYHLRKNSLKPIVLIVYDREAFFSKFDESLRITFDKNLRYKIYPSLENLFSEDLQVLHKNNFILEVKFSEGFPNWLSNLINKYQLSRKSLSKYTMCIDDSKDSLILSRKTVIGFHKEI